MKKRFIRSTIELVGKKWTISIIRDMIGFGFYPKRFKDILKANGGLTTKVLSSKLKELEENGIIDRIVTLTKPAVTLYITTERGRDLSRLLAALSSFGLKWFQTEDFIEKNKLELASNVMERRSMNGVLKHFSRQTMNLISSKWTLELITDLNEQSNQSVRFTDLLKENEGLSRKVLADRLNYLGKEELILRSTTLHSPRSIEYHLTDKGKDLDKIIFELSVFGMKWLSKDLKLTDLNNTDLHRIAEDELNLNSLNVEFNQTPIIDQTK